MLRDPECGVILCLAGSLISAGLQQVFVELVRRNMVDAIVSSGANIVDQDFFEALGFRHYIAGDEYKYGSRDAELRGLRIDRIYDTFIDEEELRTCDETTQKIINSLEPRPYSSREILREFGAYLKANGRTPAAGEQRLDPAGGVREGGADLLPGVLGLLGRVRVCGAPARSAGQGDGVDRLGEGLL